MSVTKLVQIRRSGAGLPVPGPATDPYADPGFRSPVEDGVDFSAVFADTIGKHPDLVLELPEWSEPPADVEERVWRALYEVADPEFPISLVDLGLVYGVEVDGEHVIATISLTATACPCVDFIKWDIRERLLEEIGIEEVTVNITWDPPWDVSRISERGRRALQRAGVAI
jgi:metal-sulfur cluster biosynthetic enzyme